MSTGDVHQGESAPARPGPLAVLVDDDAALRKLLRRELEKTGCRVEVFPDGKQALEACRTLRPDLIVTDIHMPVMLGTELLSRLRADGVAVPVLVISAQFDDDHLEICRSHADVAILPKPFTTVEFGKAVAGLLGK